MIKSFLASGLMVCIGLAVCGVGFGQSLVDYDWIVTWDGVDRPGPENLPYTSGWPTDNAGNEQHDPNNCYDAPGPDYAEAANVNVDGYLAIQNLMDGTCEGIGTVDGGACNNGAYLETRVNPCGMRYQIGPRTVLNYWGPEFPEIIAYHGTDASYEFGTGVTAEISFYIEQSPQWTWTTLIQIEAYPKYDNPWNGGGGSYKDNNYAKIALQHNLGDGKWHLVAYSWPNTFSLGKVEDLMGRWVTVRLALGVAPKPQMVVWVDGLINHSAGWDAIDSGISNGDSPHGFCKFGYKETDGIVHIGTMAFTNQGAFSPNPRGQCRDVGEGWRYFRYLPSVLKTRANPEICDNQADDDGDGKVDCDDPECFQNDACENLLINGSFEMPISPCEEVSCPSVHDGKPTGWLGTNLASHGDQWICVPPATDGFTRASIGETASASFAYQTVAVVPGTPVTLKGDLLGAHQNPTDHYMELLDGNESSTSVIDSFVTSGSSTTTWHAVSLTGTCTSGEVTVKWGFRNNTGGVAATHVDNLYLDGTARGKCNNPFADADGDQDVDQDDFGVWQVCYTGASGAVTPDCECFDVDGPGGLPDGWVNQEDYPFFEACATGPDIPVDASCDDAVEPSPIEIVSAVSRKTHGTQDYDLDIKSAGAVESREGGPNLIVVTFDDFVQAEDGSLDIGDEVSATGATISNVTLGCEVLTIALANIVDQSCVQIGLHGFAKVLDPSAVMRDRQLRVVALWGDTTGDGLVNSADVADINASLGPVNATNFRKDIVVNGTIDSVDALIAGTLNSHSASCP